MTDAEKQQVFDQIAQMNRRLREIGLMLAGAAGMGAWWFVYHAAVDHWGFSGTGAGLSGFLVCMVVCTTLGREFS
jgi:hypothetical protein